MTPEERAAVTQEQFLGYVRDVVSQRPDARNPVLITDDPYDSGCIYTDAEGNHCVIGQVLEEIDPGNLPPLEPVDPEWDPNVSQGAGELLTLLGYRRPVANLASTFQTFADGGMVQGVDDVSRLRRRPTWGEALAQFEKHREAQ